MSVTESLSTASVTSNDRRVRKGRMASDHKPLAVVVLCVLLTSCSGQDRAGVIECSTAYRVSTSDELTGTDSVRFVDEQSTAQSVPYTHLEFHAEYRPGFDDNERSLRVWVTPTASDQILAVQLYQLPTEEGPVDQFVGGHGFTGLTYVSDPVSGAELQYWCAAG